MSVFLKFGVVCVGMRLAELSLLIWFAAAIVVDLSILNYNAISVSKICLRGFFSFNTRFLSLSLFFFILFTCIEYKSAHNWQQWANETSVCQMYLVKWRKKHHGMKHTCTQKKFSFFFGRHQHHFILFLLRSCFIVLPQHTLFFSCDWPRKINQTKHTCAHPHSLDLNAHTYTQRYEKKTLFVVRLSICIVVSAYGPTWISWRAGYRFH